MDRAADLGPLLEALEEAGKHNCPSQGDLIYGLATRLRTHTIESRSLALFTFKHKRISYLDSRGIPDVVGGLDRTFSLFMVS